MVRTPAASQSGTPPRLPTVDLSPEDIWTQLRAAGASAVQAAGILGNAIAESSLNPEAQITDSNGYKSNGLWQFNEESYPDSGGLITGNPAADVKAQITYLTQHGGLQAASGTTYQETASNFASKFERCSGCQAGGGQNTQRVTYAGSVAGWAASGNWPATAGTAADTATLTGSAQGNPATCLWQVGWGGIPGTSWLMDIFGGGGNVASGEICLLNKSQARALAATGIVVAGALIGIAALALLARTIGAEVIAGPLLKMAGPAGKAASGAQSKATSAVSGRAEVADLKASGASDLRTAQKPPGTLQKNRPGRVTGSVPGPGRYNYRRQENQRRIAPAADKPPF